MRSTSCCAPPTPPSLSPTPITSDASGPYARWAADELTDYALGGYWSIAGHPEREPLRVPGHQAQFHAGLQIAFASLAALRHARRTGEGQEIEVSAAEAMLGAHWSTTVAWTHEGRVFMRTGSDLYRAKDGWVHFFSLLIHQNVLVLLDRPDLASHEDFQTILGRRNHLDEIEAIAREWCAQRPMMEIIEKAQSLRVPMTPMADVPWAPGRRPPRRPRLLPRVPGQAHAGPPLPLDRPLARGWSPRHACPRCRRRAAPRPPTRDRGDEHPLRGAAGDRGYETTGRDPSPAATLPTWARRSSRSSSRRGPPRAAATTPASIPASTTGTPPATSTR